MKQQGIIIKGIRIEKPFNIDEGATIGYKPARESAATETLIGKNLIALKGAIIYVGSRIGEDAIIGHNSIIREECVIGDRFKLWSNSIVDYACCIGNDVKIHSNCYVAQYTILEDGVFLAPGVTIGNDPHPGCEFSKSCIEKSRVVVKAGAQVGLNVTLVPGVTVGEGALVGAGSVVSRDVPAGCLVVGNPARVVKDMKELKCRTGLTDFPYKKNS